MDLCSLRLIEYPFPEKKKKKKKKEEKKKLKLSKRDANDIILN
jgi:hypothetical protein